MADRPPTLFERLRESMLLEPGQLEELGKLPEAHSTDPRALGRVLLARAWLTRFQINQLALGRGSELRVGNFILLDRLGEGGMGSVYKARHRLMGRVVALKVIRKERLGSDAAVKRFYQEVQAAARLSHPNIVLAYDADSSGNLHYFSMEYVEGTDLARLVKERGPLPVAQACEFVRQAALGLQHAHEKGMVHRDVKPHNLMVTRPEGGAPVVKILDLGLARTQGQSQQSGMTVLGQVIGTPDYLAPEQAVHSRAADARSDLYGLGCTLYFLLAGRPPFTGEALTEVLLKHQMEEPPPLRARRPEVPPALERVVRRLMAKRPEDRYQSAAEVAEVLEPFSRGEVPPLVLPAARAAVEDTNDTWAALGEDVERVAPAPRPRGGSRTLEVEPSARKARRPVARPDRSKVYLAAGVGGGAAVLGLLLLVVALVMGANRPPKDDLAGPGDNDKSAQADKGGVADKGRGPDKDKGGREKDKDGKGPGGKRPRPPLGPGHHVLGEHPGGARAVAVSPDGRWAASGGEDKTVRVWDLRTGEEKYTLTDLEAPARDVAFSPDSRRLLGAWGKVRGWRVEDGKPLGNLGTGYYLSPDARTGLTVELLDDKLTTRVWDLGTGTERGRFPAEDNANLNVSFSSDGKRALLVGRNHVIQECELDPPRAVGRVDSRPPVPPPVAVCCLAEPAEVLVGCADGSVQRWNMRQARVLRVFGGRHAGQVRSLALPPDGARALSAGDDRVVRLWDFRTGRELGRFEGHAGAVQRVVFCPDGKKALSAGADGSVRLWDLDRPTSVPPSLPPPPAELGPLAEGELRRFETKGKPVGWQPAFSPDGKQVIDHTFQFVRVWDVEKGREVRALNPRHGPRLSCLAVSPDWKRLVTAGADHLVKLWDLETFAERKVFRGHEAPIHDVAISPDGKYVASAAGAPRIRGGKPVLEGGQPVYDDCTVRLWDARTGSELHSFAFSHPAHLVSFSRDGKYLVAGSFANEVRVWDVRSKRALPGVPRGEFHVLTMVPGPGKDQMLFGCADGVIRVWDLAERRVVRFLKGHSTMISRLSASADAGRLLSWAGAMRGRDGAMEHLDYTMRLWDTRTGKELARVSTIPRMLHGVALSPDARYGLSSEDRGAMRLWDLTKLQREDNPPPPPPPPPPVDAPAGAEVRSFDTKRKGIATAAFFSPDGRRALTHSGPRVRLWDVATGRHIKAFEPYSGRPVHCVAVSRDWRYLATAGDDRAIKVWRLDTFRRFRTLTGHETKVRLLAFSADGKRLLSGAGEVVYKDGKPVPTDVGVRLWDVESGKEQGRFEVDAEPVRAVSFTPDGRRVVASAKGEPLRVWDAETQAVLHELKKAPATFHIAFGPEKTQVLLACGDGFLRVWDAETGKEVRPLKGHRVVPDQLGVSGDGKRAVSWAGVIRPGGRGKDEHVDYTLRLWDTTKGKELGRLDTRPHALTALAVSADGKFALTGDGRGALRLWDLAKLPAGDKPPVPGRFTRLRGHEGAVNTLVYTPDGRYLITGGQDHKLRVWDVADAREVKEVGFHGAAVRCVAVSGDGERAASVAASGFGFVCTVPGGEDVAPFLDPARKEMVCAALSPKGNELALGTEDHLRIFQVNPRFTRQVANHPNPAGRVTCVAYSSDGLALAFGDSAGVVHLWDTTLRKEARVLPTHKGEVLAVCFTPDGRRVVSAGADKVIVSREWRRGRFRRFTGHGGAVTGVAVSPDGKWLVSGSQDRTVRLWDASTGKEVHKFTGHAEGVRGVAFDPKGKHVASCGDDVRIWDLPPAYVSKPKP